MARRKVRRYPLADLGPDPDEGLTLRGAVRKRLLRQREMVAKGKFGRPLEEVLEQMGLGGDSEQAKP